MVPHAQAPVHQSTAMVQRAQAPAHQSTAMVPRAQAPVHQSTAMVPHAQAPGHPDRTAPPGPDLACNECSLTFPSRLQQARHRLSSHVAPAEHGCPICGMKFLTRSRQRVHLARSHRVLRLACPHCTARFPSSLLLGAHLLVDHTAVIRALPHPFAIECPVCSEWCVSAGQLTAHVRAFHPGAQPMHCAMCPRAFNNVSSLLLHHHGHLAAMRRQHCGVCGVWFPAQELVQAHERAEHNPRVFRCPVLKPSRCREVLPSAEALDQHLAAAHPRRRPYSCRCGTHFKNLHDHLEHAAETLHQAALPPTGGESLHVCKACLIVAEDPMKIRDHEDTVHMGLLPLDRVAQLLTLVQDAVVIKNS
ncbi:zinc finger protein 628-like [Frankliniella occidentalis]|uniref:Zinc finger protein 628-like n=1 Tax=Frankliniella occidentalis TaxID=133901 RepID=A0A9C6WLQ9_FRAOC|nr:zinc finger protein 628-like [Frankliniella occidentalis]